MVRMIKLRRIGSVTSTDNLHRAHDVGNLDGPLHSVRVMTKDLIDAGRYRNVEHSFALH